MLTEKQKYQKEYQKWYHQTPKYKKWKKAYAVIYSKRKRTKRLVHNYYLLHRKTRIAQALKWIKEHPDRHREISRNYYAKKIKNNQRIRKEKSNVER